MEIRSYRHVFDLERRIYRIDRIRLNPGGVPVRGVVYFLMLLAGALTAARVPLIGVAARAVPWYARDVALPGVLAALLTVVRLEGRPFHVAAGALLRLHLGCRQICTLDGGVGRATARHGLGEHWRPASILMLPDGSEGRARRLRYTGPGALLVAVAHERKAARGPLVWFGLRSHLRVRATPNAPPPERGEVVVLEQAIRLCVR
jgi:hypothetical protein